METAGHREPYEPRGSRTDLGAPRGESPLGDSTSSPIRCIVSDRLQSGPKPDLYAAAGERASFELLPVIRLWRGDQQGSTHTPPYVPPRQPMRFRAKLTG